MFGFLRFVSRVLGAYLIVSTAYLSLEPLYQYIQQFIAVVIVRSFCAQQLYKKRNTRTDRLKEQERNLHRVENEGPNKNDFKTQKVLLAMKQFKS